MEPNFFKEELSRLEGRIRKARGLLDEYEDILDTSSDPRERARCKRAIGDLKGSIERYAQEYTEIEARLNSTDVTDQNLREQLEQISQDLDALKSGQSNILWELDEAKQTVISQYELSQRRFVENIAQQLNHNQLQIVQFLLLYLEDNRLPEAEIREMLLLIDKHIPSLPSEQVEALEVIKDPELDIKHRLKVCLPLIPFILDYEGEVEVGSGFNLKTFWNEIKTLLQRK
ncbi:MAG: hypothetical protein F6K26_11740 [Moorea sp. SIO2I5]|nr:hypothetical protein [Moorena sp. SIO2I5]